MRNQIVGFILCFLFFSSLLVGLNYIVDPLQYYKKDKFPHFIRNERFQIPGLVRNYHFDTIFIGTSHSENFSTSKLDSYLSSKSINLAISGSSAWEQSQVVRLALAKPGVKNVIWEMNYKSFSGLNPNLINNGSFPVYLYQPDLKTPFYYLYSLDTLWLSIKRLLKKGSTEIDGLNSWYEANKAKFDGKHVVEHYCKQQSLVSKKSVADYEKNITENLLPLVSQYKEVNFVLFFPPLSVANFAINDQAQKFVEFRKAISALSENYQNIKVVDFTADFDLIGNLKNYKDIEHYSLDVSDKILFSLSNFSSARTKKIDVKMSDNRFLFFVKSWKASNNLCE